MDHTMTLLYTRKTWVERMNEWAHNMVNPHIRMTHLKGSNKYALSFTAGGPNEILITEYMSPFEWDAFRHALNLGGYDGFKCNVKNHLIAYGIKDEEER